MFVTITSQHLLRKEDVQCVLANVSIEAGKDRKTHIDIDSVVFRGISSKLPLHFYKSSVFILCSEYTPLHSKHICVLLQLTWQCFHYT